MILFFLLSISLANYYYFSTPNLAYSLTNIWCLGWFVICCIYVWRDKKINWLFFPYIFGLLTALTSCFINEATGIFLIEIQSYTLMTGATSRASSLSSFFILSTYFFLKNFLKIEKNMVTITKIKWFENYIFKFLFASTVIFILIAFYYNFPPLLTGSNRFNYFKDEALPGFRFFYSLIPFLLLLLSISYINKVIYKKTALSLFLIIIILVVMTGEKFSLFIDIAFYSMTPFILLKLIKLNRKFYLIFLLFILMLFGMVLYNYISRGDDSSFIFTRISLQGQMIYALDLIATNESDLNLRRILDSFLGLSSDIGDISMYHLMNQIASRDVVNLMIEYNQSFTNPFPSNFEYFFTIWYAPLAISVYTIIVAYSIFVFYKGVLSKTLFNVFISATIYHYITIATLMGKTERLIHPITIISFAITLLLMFFGSHCCNKSNNIRS
jgi:hypothetical protein